MTAVMEAPTRAAASAQEAADVPRKLWTRAEYRQLIKDGRLEDGKVELVNGEIWNKMGQGSSHSIVITWLIAALGPIFGLKRLHCQSSLPTGEFSNPEPDMTILAQNADFYKDNGPISADALLVAEASDSTLRADLTIKQVLYAQSGIPEYWVIDIPNRLLHIFREPTETGYASETILTTDNGAVPLAAPGSVVCVADLLP